MTSITDSGKLAFEALYDRTNGLYSGGDSVVVGPTPACFGIGPPFNITG